MILSLISAMSKNRVIGLNNSLPWDIPEDLKYFKDQTKGKIMIMGRKTFDSLPGLLPKRFHVVISRTEKSTDNNLVKFVKTLEEAIDYSEFLLKNQNWPEEVFIIGGGEIYKQSLSVANKIYLTEIENEYKGDTFFPEFDKEIFKKISSLKSSYKQDHNDITLYYNIYQK